MAQRHRRIAELDLNEMNAIITKLVLLNNYARNDPDDMSSNRDSSDIGIGSCCFLTSVLTWRMPASFASQGSDLLHNPRAKTRQCLVCHAARQMLQQGSRSALQFLHQSATAEFPALASITCGFLDDLG